MLINMSAILGAIAMSGLLCAVLWSIKFPCRRLWPVTRTTFFNQTWVWGATLIGFVSIIILGLTDWNSLGWPALLRWGLGGTMITAGNILVWTEVFGIGWKATSGAADELKTDGAYKYSRNPQYVADIGIIIGWVILSASLIVVPLAILGVMTLALAPFAEEPWLAETYGEKYVSYKSITPRFFGNPS